MIKEFCIEIDVGELRPLSSDAAVVEDPSIEGFLVGDLASAEVLGEPAPIVPLLVGEAAPLRLGLAPNVLFLVTGEFPSTEWPLIALSSTPLAKLGISKGSPFLSIILIFCVLKS